MNKRASIKNKHISIKQAGRRNHDRVLSALPLLLICAMLVSTGFLLSACNSDTSGDTDSQAGSIKAVSSDETSSASGIDSKDADGYETTDPAVSTQNTTDDSAVKGSESTSPVGSDSTSGPSSDSNGNKAPGKGSGKSDKTTTPDKSTDKPVDKPKPGDTKKPDPAVTITVTISVECKTLLAKNPELAAKLSNNGIMLAPLSIKLKSGATPYDALKTGDIKFAGKYYISSIGGLSEFDVGPKSGWIYSVNGKFPPVGVTSYKLKDGDSITFHYTVTGSDIK